MNGPSLDQLLSETMQTMNVTGAAAEKEEEKKDEPEEESDEVRLGFLLHSMGIEDPWPAYTMHHKCWIPSKALVPP